MTSIFYTLDGKINARDSDVKFDLTETLNLNCENSPLIEERKAALDGLIKELGVVDEKDRDEYCKAALEEFQSEDEFKIPYVGILLWYLQTMLNRAE